MQLSEQFTCFGVLNYGFHENASFIVVALFITTIITQIILVVNIYFKNILCYNPEFNTQTHKKAQ